MNDHTLQQLRTLKLPGFIQGLSEQQESKHYHDLPFEDRLALLLEKECLRRNHQRLLQRLKTAKLKQSATIEEVDFAVERGLNKKSFLELAQLSWLQNHHNLIIVGPTGIGKSFLACTLGDQACKMGYTVRYTKTAELISNLVSAKADGSFKKLSAELAKCHLLIIDEWLREPLSEEDAREILDLLDDRFRKTSCLFTSQVPTDDWYRLIKDPTIAEAILDRIVHDSVKLRLKGPSMRELTSKLSSKKKGASVASLR